MRNKDPQTIFLSIVIQSIGELNCVTRQNVVVGRTTTGWLGPDDPLSLPCHDGPVLQGFWLPAADRMSHYILQRMCMGVFRTRAGVAVQKLTRSNRNLEGLKEGLHLRVRTSDDL